MESSNGQADNGRPAMVLRILVLSLGSFAVGTGTFVVTGVLKDIAEDLSISVASAGLLVTVFAATFAVGSPVLVVAAGNVGRRRLLVGALVLFALAKVAAALAPSFSVLLGARVAAACGAAVFTPVASAVATSFAPPELRGRALSVRTMGVNIAWLVGVPLGTVVGGHYGWRTSFVLVAVLATGAALGVRALLPAVEASARGGFPSNLRVVKSGAVVAGLGLTILALMASFVVLTYVRPVLENLTHLATGGVGLMLAVFGLASIPGALLSGYVADRWGCRISMITVLAVLSVSLFSFSVLPAAQAGSVLTVLGTVAALVAWSVAAFAFLPLQQYRLIEVAPEGQNAALALNASAIQAGQGIGAGLGALALYYGSVEVLGGRSIVRSGGFRCPQLPGSICTTLTLH
ncbi:MAG: Arabinose efflux permease [Rubrobacteraceae bacterium]|nr:Arabinose efflux permease [Rubrobacteraceae bacterium]